VVTHSPGNQYPSTRCNFIDQVEKQTARFYTIYVTQQIIDDGFVIAAHSLALSKFKLLMFEQTTDGQWEMIAQASLADIGTVTVFATYDHAPLHISTRKGEGMLTPKGC